MKNTIRVALLAASLGVVSAANALTFQTVAGSTFTNYFTVTTTAQDALALTVSGLAAQYASLSFEILSGGPTATAVLSSGSLIAGFSDPRNSGFNLPAGTYSLKVDGVTKNSQIPGAFGVVSVNAVGGTVTAVPEPESYALMLAGLGLIGTIALRRSKASRAT